MKIICIHNNYILSQSNNAGDGTLINQRPWVTLKPDSSLLHGGKPMFIPDFPDGIEWGAALVLRVCRLGKCVSRKYARRYYDAVTVGVSFKAAGHIADDGCHIHGNMLYDGFDGATVVGDFVPVDALTVGDEGLSFAVSRNGETVQEGKSDDLLRGFDSLIATVSAGTTIKMGDLIFTGFPSEEMPVAVGDNLCGTLCGSKVLDFRIK